MKLTSRDDKSYIEIMLVSILMPTAVDDDLLIPEVPADEAMTDPIEASEEEPRDFGVVPEPSHGMISFAFPPFLYAFIC